MLRGINFQNIFGVCLHMSLFYIHNLYRCIIRKQRTRISIQNSCALLFLQLQLTARAIALHIAEIRIVVVDVHTHTGQFIYIHMRIQYANKTIFKLNAHRWRKRKVWYIHFVDLLNAKLKKKCINYLLFAHIRHAQKSHKKFFFCCTYSRVHICIYKVYNYMQIFVYQ